VTNVAPGRLLNLVAAAPGGGSSSAPSLSSPARQDEPGWAVTSAQSEFGFSLDLPAPRPLTSTPGPDRPAPSASVVGLASPSAGFGKTGADLFSLWVDPPAKAFQAAAVGFEGDDSITLFEAVSRARPASPQAPSAPASPSPGDESPGPRSEAPRPAGRSWVGWLAPWLVVPLFAWLAGRKHRET
jgi:hypothetical protein